MVLFDDVKDSFWNHRLCENNMLGEVNDILELKGSHNVWIHEIVNGDDIDFQMNLYVMDSFGECGQNSQ